MATKEQSRKVILMDQVRQRMQSLSKAEKMVQMIIFFSQHPVFPPISCSGPVEKCSNNCAKKQFKKMSWIFEENDLKDSETVDISLCQIKFG